MLFSRCVCLNVQVFESLDDIEEHIRDMESNAKRFQHYQQVCLFSHLCHTQKVVKSDLFLTESLSFYSLICPLNQVLQLDPEPYEDLSNIKQDFDIKNSLWRSQREWDQWTDKWLVDTFAEIRTEEIARETQKYLKVISRASRRLGMSSNLRSICQQMLHSFAHILNSLCSPPSITHTGSDHAVVALLKSKVDKFHKAVPIVSDLKNPALEQRHWDEITTIIGYSVKENADTTTLGTLIELNVMKYQEDLATISSKAVQEAELKKMLMKIEREWKDLALVVVLYKEQKDNFVLGVLDDVIAKVSGAFFVSFFLHVHECWY